MASKWEIVFEEDDDTLEARLLLDDDEIDSYEYYSWEDSDDEIESCFEQFRDELSDNGVSLTQYQEARLKKIIEDKFEEFEEDEDDDSWSWNNSHSHGNLNRSEIIDDISENQCAYSQYVIDTCVEKVNRGAKGLIPGVDRVPKSISFVTRSGSKYYAKIQGIRILSKSTKKELTDEFDSNDENVILVVESQNKKFVVAFVLGYIGESTDDRTLQFYMPNNIKSFDIGEATVVFGLDNCQRYYHTNSPLAPKLTPILNYYNHQLNEINQKTDTIKLPLDVDLLRENFDEFKALAVDENMIIVPVTGDIIRIKGISILTEDYGGKITKYDFYDGNLTNISKENKDSYIEALKESGVSLSKGVDLAVLSLVNLSDKDVYLIKRVLTDGDIRSCTVINNVEGDRVRLKRILRGIENALTGTVVNSRLVNLICNNDIYSSVNMSNVSEFTTNDERIDQLRNDYPILTNNYEQLVAIDKILQMKENDTDIMLIQGPPGTGKTELIFALAKELSKAGQNTLITSNVHVACDNIVDRLKNNKDLILKRYTSIRGEQYEKEIIENKKKYVQNQVLEGFKFKDFVIDSSQQYESISNIINEEKARKAQIYASKASYDNDLLEYNNYIHEKERLEKEIICKDNEIDACKSEITECQESLTIKESAISDNATKIDAHKSELTSLEDTNEKDQQTVNQKSTELTELYNNVSENENAVLSLHSKIERLTADIEKNERKKNEAEQFRTFLLGVDEDIISNAVTSRVIDDVAFSSIYYNNLLNTSIKKSEDVAEVYKRLKQDSAFWNDGANITVNTLEYVYFKSKKSGVIADYLDENCLKTIEELYSYCKVSSAKHNIMSILPFVKINGHNKKYYEGCLSRLNLELKKIQFNYVDYITDYVKTEASNQLIEDKVESLAKEIKIAQDAIDQSNLDIETSNYSISKSVEKISSIKDTMKTLTNDLWKAKKKLDTNLNKINDTKEIIRQLTANANELEQVRSELISTMKATQCKLEALSEEYQQLKILLKNAEDNVRNSYLAKQEQIDNYDMFINKMSIDLRQADKIINKYESILNRIQSKIDELVSTGWKSADAQEIVFNYAYELERIVECDSGKVENSYFVGRGNEFGKMFLLSEKSDGSLISMTTNQIASLLTSADNRDLTFDYAIIDEASKCRFEDLIISLPRIKHLVLIGDFMQLDPMYEPYANLDLKYQNMFSIDDWDALNRSSFSLLLSQFVNYNEENEIHSFDTNPYVAVMKRQYRMNKGIFRLIEPVYAIHKGFDLIDEKQTSANDVKCVNVHGEEIGLETSQYNIEEAEAIVSFLTQFQVNRKSYPNIKTIGIITGYRAQENYLRRKLKSIKISGIQIGTFDRFQGREYDLVIVSLVRTKRLGFTNNVRRMNVAFSRAKNHLLIFGNFDALNKIALKTSANNNDDYSNTSAEENQFVVKTLIPQLYSLRETYVSDEERTADLLGFIKENDYEQ